MPFTQPSRGDVHVNAALTDISLGFLQENTNFVAGRVFPTIPVAKQSDKYFTYDRGYWNRDEMEERAPGTESAGGTYAISTASYLAETFGYHRDVADQVRANADAAINLDREATDFVTLKALINREVNWVSTFFPASHAPGGVWTFDVDGASSATAASSFDPTSAGNNDKVYWDTASSTPIEDVRQGKRYVLESTGFDPNVLTLGKSVYDSLLDHPDIVGRIDRGQTSGAALANKTTLADLFEVDEVLVAQAIKTTTVEGQDNTHSFIAGKNALLSYRPPRAGLMTPAAGYTFAWTGFLGATAEGMRIKRFRREKLSADRIEIESAYDQKVISADLGYYFGSIVEN